MTAATGPAGIDDAVALGAVGALGMKSAVVAARLCRSRTTATAIVKTRTPATMVKSKYRFIDCELNKVNIKLRGSNVLTNKQQEFDSRPECKL